MDVDVLIIFLQIKEFENIETLVQSDLDKISQGGDETVKVKILCFSVQQLANCIVFLICSGSDERFLQAV